MPNLKMITARLEYFVDRSHALGLQKFDTKEKGGAYRAPSSSMVDKSRIFGRDDEKEKLIQRVLFDGGGVPDVSVIAVTGMGADTVDGVPDCSTSVNKQGPRHGTPKISPANSVASIKHLKPINELDDMEENVCQSNDLVRVLSSALAKALAEKGAYPKGPRNIAKQKQGVQPKKIRKPPKSTFGLIRFGFSCFVLVLDRFRP
ncbi:hypothetical protein LIER_40055 [Lithospermum erythrorhizon]|uniref:Uncharacterized protein n=1 Tax=Lithospermum erythrorhizon TaxID=34254 RepID=A0AAV3QP05_LITER